MLVAPSAGSSTPPTLSWQQAAQRSRFPVYRPRRSSALKPSVVRVSSSGCVNAVWGSVTTGTSPYLILYQPGESVQCGQAGEANQVATAVIHGTKVNVLVQCNRIPHCSVRDGETQGIFILSVPEPGSPHYSVEFQSHHMLLRDLLTVARSLVRVRAAKAPGAPGPGSSHAVPVLGDARAGTAGFGKAQPSLIAEANNPLTEVGHIHWQGWGAKQATGAGTGYWLPPGKPLSGSLPAPARIVAFDLGSCHGRRAYLKEEHWIPSHGGRFDSRNAYPTCL